MKKTLFFLMMIILLAAFLRFWQLGSNPPSLTWDEASWGYNAYALGIDGRDEFGKFLPIQYLESFGDFKPVLYAYLTILPVKIFGLNEFSTRFASALFGVLTVAVTYFLTKLILKQVQNDKEIAMLAAFFLAISPWHINLSRAAFEANVASFFIVCGVWLFLVAMDGKKYWLIGSVISFVLSTYTFNTARIVSPLLFLILFIGSKTYKNYKTYIISFFIGFLLFLPLLQFLLTPQAKLRFQEVNIFTDAGIVVKTNQEIVNDNGAWWSKILHNRRFVYGQEFVKHYLDHFNPAFLFIKGDGNPKFSTGDVGQLYLWDLPFLILGMLLLFKKKEGFWWIIPLWLMVGIIPAATARETPHALRIETTLPVWQIITAYGFYQFWGWLKKNRHPEFSSGSKMLKQVQHDKILNFKFLIVILIFSFLTFNSIYYLHGYYIHYPRESSGEWQYGYKEAISYVKSMEKEYDKIYFTDSLGRPYIYFLFYLQENPEKFRQTAKIWREAYGFVHVDGYGKYEFMNTLKTGEPKDGKNLFIDSVNNLPGGVRSIKTFNLLNGNPVLTVYTR